MKGKRILYCGVSLCGVTLNALAGGPEILPAPNYFDGFFIGATGAFHQAGFDGNASATANQDLTGTQTIPTNGTTLNVVFFPAGTLTQATIDSNAYTGFYGVQGGFGRVFRQVWYAGVVGFGEWGDQSDTSTSSTNATTNLTIIQSSTPYIMVPSTTTYTSSTTVKISNDYGVAFKPGLLLGPKTMVYGKIGAVWADMKISNSFAANVVSNVDQCNCSHSLIATSANLSGSSSSESTKPALLLGLGVEQFIYRNRVTVNVEYNYANYGSVTTTAPLNGSWSIGTASTPTTTGTFPAGAAETSATASAKVSTLLGGLNFYFGDWF